MILTIVLFAAVLFAAAIVSGMETGVYSLERVRLEVRAERGDRKASRLLALVADPASCVCALLLATNVAHYLLAHYADQLVAAAVPGLGAFGRTALDTALLAPVLFVLGDLLPKNVFMRSPGFLMSAFQPLLSFLNSLFRPLTWPIVRFAKPKGSDPVAEAESSSIFDRGSIHYLLTVDDESAGLTASQRALAARVMTLKSLRVQDRMVPLKIVAAVPDGASADLIVSEGARSGHSRLPIFDPAGRSFTGYVSVIDAATAMGSFDLAKHRHALPSVPCDLPVTAALYRLQRAGRPIASVLAPDGRTLGIIAVSDIVAALFKS